MNGEISRPPYKVRGAVAGGKELAVPFEANPELGNAEERGRQMTVQEAGKRGGRATLERHGAGFFRKIGTKGGRRTKHLYAHLLSEFGKKGGRPKRPALDEPMREEDQR